MFRKRGEDIQDNWDLWPYHVSMLIALSLAEIKPVYYPGEEKLVSLDMLKLYRGEDVVRQEPADVDPD